MTQASNVTTQPKHLSAGKRMLIGAAIGLALISLFLIPAPAGDLAWGKLWMMRPLLVVPLAGALGGLCNYILLSFHKRLGLNKIIAMVLSGVIFIIGLWLGSVLGLAGTFWH